MSRNPVPTPRNAALIYNPNAGGAVMAPEALERALHDVGIEALHRPTTGPEDLAAALGHDEDAVVVVGGDGTLREVAKRLLDAPRPIIPIPAGTANNVARSLGLDRPPRAVLAGLGNLQSKQFDVARVRGPWGEELLLEGAGVGVFANILSSYRPEAGKSLLRAAATATDELGSGEPIRCRMEVDGQELEGDYLLVEAMNTRAVGPRLPLAPEADPSDGLLDVVLVSNENRDALMAYFRALMAGAMAGLRSVEIVRAKRLKINWRSSAFHVDSVAYCEEAREAGTKGYSALVEMVPGALEMWLPRTEEGIGR